MKEKTKYEIDKGKKKEKLVRNEFIYQGRSEGRVEFPIIKKQNIDVNKIKFFKYEDPYSKTEIAQCPVCNSVCLTDKFGNGECQNCGWNLCKLEITEDTVCYPNIVSLKKAREQFLQGKKFIPSFDDFIEGLKMYSEMSFQYENKDYGVFYYTNGKVELFQDNVPESLQTYNDVQAFKRYASINGKLLSVIWDDVKNVNYMS